MGALGHDHDEMEDASDYELSPLVRAVREALKDVSVGKRNEYEELIGYMHDEMAKPGTILRAITGAVFDIDVVHHQSLLSSISAMSWWNYGPDVMDALVKLVVALASRGKYIDLCLEMLVNNFTPPDNFVRILKQPLGLAKKDQVILRVHTAFKEIADLFPLAPSRLEQIVRERVPVNIKLHEAHIAVYIENMLKLESGDMRELIGHSMIFELVKRLVDLDMEIGCDEVLLDDPNNEGIFEMELEDTSRSTRMDMDEAKKEYRGRKVLQGNTVAQKLDTLMDLTFDHLRSCYESGRLHEVFKGLLQSFESSVYKSKFAQFVMFYACSLDPEDCGTQFVSRLLEIFRSTADSSDGDPPQNDPPDLRIKAVAYLEGYLSRAKFVSASDVIIILESLVDWCYKYCKNQSGIDIQKDHSVFDAGCQAVMYVLCFRLRSILATPQLKSQLLNMPLEYILKHALKRLEVCSPSIVEEFTSQAKAAGLFRFDTDASHGLGGFQRLKVYLPFDPYLLEKSDRFIRPNYLYWSMVRPIYHEVDDEDVDDVSVEDDYEDEDEDDSLSKMSITPRDSFMFGDHPQDRKLQMPSRIRPSTSPESL